MSGKKIAKDWYEVISCGDGVHLIREIYVAPWLRCNMWHISGRDRDLLIDTGMGLRPLKKEVALLRDRPLTALCTHSHFDHMGGAHQFTHRLGHRLEAEIYAGAEAQDGATLEEKFGAFIRAETFSALPNAGFSYQQFAVQPAPLTAHVDDGDVVDLGDRHFTVFHLPGHSPGSIALYETATRTLFSGDVIYDGRLYDSLYHSDKQQYRESLHRLKELPVAVVYGGHYASFGEERMHEIIDDYLAGGGTIDDERAWVEEQIRLAAEN